MARKLLRLVRALGAAVMCAAFVSGASAEFVLHDMDFVLVGNPGNAGNQRHTTTQGYGAVADNYLIGKYEVTAGQYTDFLNAVAKSDPSNLWNSQMWSGTRTCKISRTGSDENYVYSVDQDWANRPVNYVSFWSALRYANWLHNEKPTGAQGPGTTEGGAYVNIGDVATFARTAGAKFSIPTHHEWYKAAFYDPAIDNYWDYPMRSDTEPSNDLLSPDPGNSGNFLDSDYTVGDPYYRTPVGAFTNSATAYGTYDQGGNVNEWTEHILFGTHQGVFGGSAQQNSTNMHAQQVSYRVPEYVGPDLGFRVAASYSNIIPEPASATLLLLAALAGLLWRRR